MYNASGQQVPIPYYLLGAGSAHFKSVGGGGSSNIAASAVSIPLVNGNPFFNLAEKYEIDLCLGCEEDGMIGVVIETTGVTFESVTKKNASLQTLVVGDKNVIHKVMSLGSGRCMHYTASDLVYADNSKRGDFLYSLPPPLITHNTDFTQNGSSSTSAASLGLTHKTPFKANDKVKLSPTCVDQSGCLKRVSDGLVGVIYDGAQHGYGIGNSRNQLMVQLMVNNTSSGISVHVYAISDLIHASLPLLDQSPKQLSIGDRVMLSDDFSQNNGDGWCLGEKGEGVVGCVIHIPTTSSTSIQRDVLVAAVRDPTIESNESVFSFQSSWLQRAPNTNHLFSLRDKVQLDISKWTLSPKTDEWIAPDEAAARKCLGNPAQGKFGFVVSNGSIKDGIQRNIEVMGSDGTVSFYSAISLVPAVRASVLDQCDISSLTKLLEKLITSTLGPSILMDVASIVKKNGLRAWSLLTEALTCTKTLTCADITAAHLEWNSSRPGSWPAEPELLGKHLEFAEELLRKKAPEEIESFWTCIPCRFDKNPSSKQVCIACKKPGVKWVCSWCSCFNKVGDKKCLACLSERNVVVEQQLIKSDPVAMRYLVIVDQVSIRAEPTLTSPEVGPLLEKGDFVEIIPDSNMKLTVGLDKDIVRVKLADGSGWISLAGPKNEKVLELIGPIKYSDSPAMIQTLSKGPALSNLATKAKVLYDYEAKKTNQISLKKGQIINVIKVGEAKKWSKGEEVGTGKKGQFPTDYVQIIFETSTTFLA